MAETPLLEFPHLADLPPTLSDTTTGTPDRRPASVRRTATIDMTWPGGLGTPLELELPAGWEFEELWVNYPAHEPQQAGKNRWVWELEDIPAVESLIYPACVRRASTMDTRAV